MKTTLRALVVMLTLVLLAAPLAAEAQQAWKIPRIGFLSPRSPSDVGRLAAFRQGLRELGYVEGQNIAIESRWAEGKYDRLPGLAAELVRLKVDVIVTYAAPAIRAARRATGTIPIVMARAIDPVASGLVTNVARPGGNITGLSLLAPELVGKQLEILIPAWACRRDGRRRPWIPGAHRFRETMEPSARSPGIYELSFHCPLGLSGAPLWTRHASAGVVGMILGNEIAEMTVYRETEIDREKDSERTLLKLSTMHLGIAIDAASLLGLNSRLLGSTVGDWLKGRDLLRTR